MTYNNLSGIALGLCCRIQLGTDQFYRLVGVGLSNFQEDGEAPSPLFNEQVFLYSQKEQSQRSKCGKNEARRGRKRLVPHLNGQD